MCSRVAVAAGFVGALLVSIHARQQDPLTFRSRVDLVQLDVVVTDKDGRPIDGLTRDNFTLMERGVQKPIEALRAVARPRTSGAPLPMTLGKDVATNGAALADQVVVLMIDDLHMTSSKTPAVKTIARRIASEIAPEAPMAILTTSGRLTLELTTDHALVFAAIDGFVDRVDAGMPEAPRPLTIRGLPVVMSPGMELATRGPGGVSIWGGGTGPPPDMARFFGALSVCKLLQTAANLLTTSRVQRKAFVWISGEIPVLLGASPSQTPVSVSTVPTGDLPRRPPQPERPCAPVATETCNLPAVLGALGRANVSTYMFDTGGAAAGPAAQLVGCTGGRTARPNDLDAGIERLVDDLDHYYVLGFAVGEVGDGKYRDVVVSVNVPGAVVRVRTGYVPTPATDPVMSTSLADLSADALPDSGLPMRMTAVPMPLAGGGGRILIALEITADDRALASGGALRDAIEYSVLAADLKKKQVVARTPGRRTEFTRRPARARDGVTDLTTVQIVTSIDAPAGAYQLRAAARSEQMALGGSVYQTLVVPDFSNAPLMLGGLVIGYMGEPRLPNVDSTLTSSPLPFQPTLDREFQPDDTIQVMSSVVHKTARGGAVVTAALVDVTGRTVRQTSVTIGPGAVVEAVTSLPLKDLNPGGYRLRLTVVDGALSAAREVGVVIR